MGEPITLSKAPAKEGDAPETVKVYGQAQAAVYRAQGYTSETFIQQPFDDLTKLEGATDAIVKALAERGFTTYAAVATAKVDDLVAIPGIAQKTAGKLKASASELS